MPARPSLDVLLRRIAPAVERQLRRYPFDAEDRRDLAQTALLRIVRGLRAFRGDSAIGTWVFRITANEALKLLRTRRRQRALALGLSSRGALSNDVRDPLHARLHVRAALGALAEHERDLVVAHYHLDLSPQELAKKLGVKEGAVRVRLHRARARLRSLCDA
jgi:RNA polymerase sigma-70 factor, ECF subfamily